MQECKIESVMGVDGYSERIVHTHTHTHTHNNPPQDGLGKIEVLQQELVTKDSAKGCRYRLHTVHAVLLLHWVIFRGKFLRESNRLLAGGICKCCYYWYFTMCCSATGTVIVFWCCRSM